VSRAPAKEELRARRRALRRELATRKRDARQRVQELPEVRRARRRRWIRRALWVLVLLAIVFFARCECGPKPSPAVPPPSRPPDAGLQVLSPAPPVVRAKAPRLHAGVTKVNRAQLSEPAATPAIWLDELQLQVSARGARMAQCFSAASGPGALRWTVSLDAASGAVSDQVFELVGTGADLSSTARECLSRILSSPPYHLSASKDQPIPQRVSMVIEF
jgi:hypothetical protein